MTVTPTIVTGPGVVPGFGLMSIYKAPLDTSFLGTGETLNLTGLYSEVHGITECGNNAIADTTYDYKFVIPSHGTEISSTTVLLSVTQSPSKTGATEAAEAFAIASGANLSTVGELSFMVVGKAIT